MLPPAEEFPLEEIEGVPDWNASAWASIQARDAKALQPSQLGSHLANLTVRSLGNIKQVLTQEPQDVALWDAITAEIERRRNGGGHESAQGGVTVASL